MKCRKKFTLLFSISTAFQQYKLLRKWTNKLKNISTEPKRARTTQKQPQLSQQGPAQLKPGRDNQNQHFGATCTHGTPKTSLRCNNNKHTAYNRIQLKEETTGSRSKYKENAKDSNPNPKSKSLESLVQQVDPNQKDLHKKLLIKISTFQHRT